MRKWRKAPVIPGLAMLPKIVQESTGVKEALKGQNKLVIGEQSVEPKKEVELTAATKMSEGLEMKRNIDFRIQEKEEITKKTFDFNPWKLPFPQTLTR